MGNCEFNKNTSNNNQIGTVWKVSNRRDKKVYAMKEMSKSVILAKRSVTSVNFEKDLLCRISHPFICNICYAFQDAENLYLVLEYSGGGDLRYQLYKGVKFNEEQTTASLLIALNYLHSELCIIHRDLKPENILFDKEGFLKITDFGIARTFSPNNQNDTSGTPGYLAPEVINAQPHGFCADYWALGVIIYELMFKRRPYSGIYRKQYKEELSTKMIHLTPGEQAKGWSDDICDLLNNLLRRKPEERLGYNGCYEIKQHPWFKNIIWDEFEAKNTQPPFIPSNGDEKCDEGYLISFEISDKLKEEIFRQSKNIRNYNVQKYFKNFYFDQDEKRIIVKK